MPPDLRAEVEAIGTVIRYGGGRTIHQRGDRKPGLSIIVSGGVLFSVTDRQGRAVTTARFGEGESFGEFTLFAGLPRTHDATAIGETRIRQISKPQFFALLDRAPSLRDHLLKHLTRLLAFAATRLDDERRLSLKARVAKTLLEFLQRHPAENALKVTQSELAETFGVSRVAMGTALGELCKKGLIKTGYGTIAILSPEQLSAWVYDQTGLAPLQATKDADSTTP